MIDDLLATKTRIDAFISDPLNNPLTNSEQLILAGYYSYILNVRASLEALPAQEITDHHLQMFINSHENGFAMIVPCKIELLIAKECLERRRLERETALTKQPNNVDDLLCAVEEVLRLSDRKHDAWNRAYAAIASIRNGVTAPAQPVIPGQLTLRMAEEKALSLGAVLYDEEAEVFADGWNACCAEMLKAQSVSEPCKLNGWISVDNELPEEGARVLVFSDGAFVLLAEFTGGEFYDVVRDGEEFFETVTRCVTHWMPLPAAPAQESE